jgi:hypothetical protein
MSGQVARGAHAIREAGLVERRGRMLHRENRTPENGKSK